MNWTPCFKQLNSDLADFYPSHGDMIRLSRQANIRTSFIQWNNQALNDWFNIIEEAEKQKKLLDLLTIIKSEERITDIVESAILELSQNSKKHFMAVINFPNQTEVFIQNAKDLVNADKLEDAIQILRGVVTPVSTELENRTINFSAQLYNLQNQQEDGVLTQETYQVNRSQIRVRMLNFIRRIPEEISLQNSINSWKQNPIQKADTKINVSDKENLERIIGGKNEMVMTSWFIKGYLASKSVCRIIIGGRAEGTGFLIKGGYVMTCNHVLDSKIKIGKTEIEFNYEEGQNTTVKYKLNSSDYRYSPESKLDYSLIKVIDLPDNPLKQWGHVEFENKVEPRVGDPVNIIQHPWGELKQLAFKLNDITHIWDDKIFYIADTDKGSSGSPVFNQNWKVIAIHSRGQNEQDGGIQVDELGTMAAANQGFCIKAICQDLGFDTEG